MKNKEKILIVEDTPVYAEKLKRGLISAGYDCDHIASMRAFEKSLLENRLHDYDLGIFDIHLIESDPENMDGIDAAEKFNKILQRPTLFVTSYDYSERYYSETQRRVEHSAYCSKSGENWVSNVLRQVETAKKIFGLMPKSVPLVMDRITFKQSGKTQRICLKKDEIFYITKQDPVSIFFTSKGEYSLHAPLSAIERQIKSYEGHGWCFKKISGGCIINLEKVLTFDLPWFELEPLKEGEKNITIKAGEMIREFHFEEWFPSLATR